MFDIESGLEIAFELTRSEIGELEAASSALGEQLNHLLVVEAGLLSIKQGLADTKLVECDHHLVSGLGMLTGAGTSHELNILRVDLKQVFGTGESFLCATDHCDELAELRAGVAARDWSIHRVHTSISGSRSDVDCELRAAGRVINEGCSTLHVLEDANLFIEHHSLNIMWVAEHQEEVISLLSDILGCHELSTCFDKVVSL